MGIQGKMWEKNPEITTLLTAYILANQLHGMFKGVSAIESNKMQERGWNPGECWLSEHVCVSFGVGDRCHLEVTLDMDLKEVRSELSSYLGEELGVQRPSGKSVPGMSKQ